MSYGHLRYVGGLLACGLTLVGIVVAAPEGAKRKPEGSPACIVKEQRLILSDGSAILLDHLAIYGTASEYFEKGKHPTATHSAGRIQLPRQCRLGDGSLLNAGWYSIRASLKPGADEVSFVRTKGLACLQSAYGDLIADIRYRVAHADTDGNGEIDRKESWRALYPTLPPRPLRDTDAHRVPYGGTEILGDRSSGPLSGCGVVLEKVSVPMRVTELREPRERSSLDLLPTDTKGAFTLEIVFGRYRGSVSLSVPGGPDRTFHSGTPRDAGPNP